ncbi:MAG: serine hydrolase, partial [bacterium]|nr:serine hydrolase [bacterium]
MKKTIMWLKVSVFIVLVLLFAICAVGQEKPPVPRKEEPEVVKKGEAGLTGKKDAAPVTAETEGAPINKEDAASTVSPQAKTLSVPPKDGGSQAGEKNAPLSLSDIDKRIRKLLKKGNIPGAVIVTVRQGEELIRTYGYADGVKTEPTADTLFQLGPCSQPFTALAALQLEKEGRIRLDEPVSTYLPGFKMSIKQQAYPITLRQLLLQTGGIPENTISCIREGNGKDALQQAVNNLAGRELSAIPGTRFIDTPINYTIIGAVIEKVTGMTFEDYLQKQVLKPLGLENTYAGRNETSTHSAVGHKIGFFSARSYQPPEFRGYNPSTFFISNGNDMARWLKLQLGLMQSPFGELIQKSCEADLTTPPSPLTLGNNAMGRHVFQENGGRIVQAGSTPNFSAYMAFNPSTKTAVAVLANSNSAMTTVLGKIVLRTLNGEKNIPAALPPASFDKYVSLLSIIMMGCLLLVLAYLVVVIMGIVKGVRSYSPVTGRKILSMIGGIIVCLPFVLGIYLLPRALMNGIPWSIAAVWTSIGFPAAALLFLITLGTALLVSFFSLLFPHENKLKNSAAYIITLSALSGIGNSTMLFIIINSFASSIPLKYMVYYFCLALYMYVVTFKVVQSRLVVITNDLVYDFRMGMIDKVFSTIFQRFEKIDSGRIYSTLNNDTLVIGNSPSSVLGLIVAIVIALSSFVYLSTIAFLPTVLTLLVTVSITILYSFVSQKANILLEGARDTQNVFLRLLEGIIKGYKELNLHAAVRSEYRKEMHDTCNTHRTWRNRAFIKLINASLVAESQIFIQMGIITCGYTVMFSDIDAYSLLSFVMVLLYMIGPVGTILIGF